MFSFIELRFYRPALTEGIQSALSQAAEVLDNYLERLAKLFYEDFVEDPYVKQSFAFERSGAHVQGREDAAEKLFAAVPALTGIRIIGTDGKKIQYSTVDSDILQQNDQAISYKSYTETDALPYEAVAAAEGEAGRLICNPESGEIIYVFPFYDIYAAYRGTLIFYTAASDFMRELAALNLGFITDTFACTGTLEVPVFVLSFPAAGGEIIKHTLPEYLQDTQPAFVERIPESGDFQAQLLFSRLSRSGIYVSRLYGENLFILPESFKILLSVSVFISIFLFIFLLFNIQRDDMLVIRDTIRRFQFAVINEYLKRKEEVDWDAVYAGMLRRKYGINRAVKRTLGRRAKRHMPEVDYLLDKSWNEITAVLQSRNSADEAYKAEKTVSGEFSAAVRSEHSVKQAASVLKNNAENTDEPEDLEELCVIEEPESFAEDDEDIEVLQAFEELETSEAAEYNKEPETAEFVEEFESAEKTCVKDEPLPPDSAPAEDEAADDIFTFGIAMPDFSDLDAAQKTEKEFRIENGEQTDCGTDVSAAEFIGNTPFSFTVGKYPPSTKPLSAVHDSILEKDGLFFVSRKAGDGMQERSLDTEFKTLVDSVLK